MKTREVIHTVTINAPPAAVFKALMDSKQHAKFTDAPAKMSGKVSGAFSCYGNYIKGYNLELKKPGLIVQAWRGRDWPAEVWSIVTFKLAKLAGGKTKISFSHVGVPAGDYNSKNKGWSTHYWQPLKKFLEKS